MSPTALPTPKRVVTGHNSSGQACVVFHDEVVLKGSEKGKKGVIWATNELVPDVTKEGDLAKTDVPQEGVIVNPNGQLVAYVDFGPKSDHALHFTQSIDYGVVLFGEIVLTLDDGSETVLKTGLMFINLPAQPVSINGKPLDPSLFKA
ncbi:hypothetical protein MNV49_005823 [Pseudohyphozyma bogoriensis]|nr:hypothetical protein MNV49_005823 [Pseudohyphozyma bogoriensis]